MITYFLLLGGNLGDRFQTLKKARNLIEKQAGTILQQSTIYETAPWGVHDQPPFYNQVIIVRSSLQPLAVLTILQRIEAELGRTRHQKWHARTIDIDILFADELFIKQPRLQIPHPELQNRRFTLVPLVELAPDFIHPLLQLPLKQLLENCPDPLSVNALDLPEDLPSNGKNSTLPKLSFFQS